MRKHWRMILAVAPLPMLALAASWGVYRYAAMFVPQWVAIAQAAAFESVYISLALVNITQRQRQRARLISIGAVLASIIYNSLSSWLDRTPHLLTTASYEAWLALAALHGLPLAWVAWLVSDLLLHQAPDDASHGAPALVTGAPELHHDAPLVSIQQVIGAPALAVDASDDRAVRLSEGLRLLQTGAVTSVRAAARQSGAPESTLARRWREEVAS